MIRLFIAFPLAEEVRNRIESLITALRTVDKNVKWVKAENLHMTLRFLGDTEERLIDRLSELIDTVATGHSPVRTALAEVGCFPNMARPRVIWIGHDDPDQSLGKIARQIELKVRELRFPKEKRRFTPHLTIGRMRRPDGSATIGPALQDLSFEPISIAYDRISLYKSTLTPGGPIYEVLHEARLSTTERFGD